MKVVGLNGKIISMNKVLKNKYIQLLFRYILGAVFIYASLDKILMPGDFSDLIDNYHVTPIQINNLIALFLPWIELLIGIGLITGILLEGSILLVICLLFLFIIILSQAVVRGIDTHCGCFKTIESADNLDYKAILLRRIFEDVIFLGMAISLKFNIKTKDRK